MPASVSFPQEALLGRTGSPRVKKCVDGVALRTRGRRQLCRAPLEPPTGPLLHLPYSCGAHCSLILPIVPDWQTEPQQALMMAVCHLNPKHLWGLPTLPCLQPHPPRV